MMLRMLKCEDQVTCSRSGFTRSQDGGIPHQVAVSEQVPSIREVTDMDIFWKGNSGVFPQNCTGSAVQMIRNPLLKNLNK